MIEIWKPSTKFPHMSVSNYGRVRNDNTGKIRKVTKCAGSRYPVVSVWDYSRGKRSHLRVHTEVARLHIPNPDNKPEVNHIDGDHYNNHVSNLEWVTHSENMKHAYITGICPKPNARTQPVECYDSDMTLIGRYNSILEASDATGISKNGIYCALYRNSSKPVNGFIWKRVTKA